MSNTDLVLALIKCGKVMKSATPDTMQTKYARKYKNLTSKFFYREIRKGRTISKYTIFADVQGRLNERAQLAEDLLIRLERGEYK